MSAVLFLKESEKFLETLKDYTNNKISIKTVIKQCKRMNLAYDSQHIKVLRQQYHKFLKMFNDRLTDIDDVYTGTSNTTDNIEDFKNNTDNIKDFKNNTDNIKDFKNNTDNIEEDVQNKTDKEDVQNKTDNIKDGVKNKIGIVLSDELVHHAIHLGLSQNIPINRTGGLPAFPLKEMLNIQEVEHEEAFEF
ncbi:hypothetical protein M153_6097000872 [Pseudoloma neurophilia]|uniref:Uncharacterized protein n=1 Tax=Pseudoloma neurophilia TaxID=146866 RepID=A0A0R0LSJ2_9MICR|nr:hypothetical protein M153_6097000872 [Pseudoloma neurophilia]